MDVDIGPLTIEDNGNCGEGDRKKFKNDGDSGSLLNSGVRFASISFCSSSSFGIGTFAQGPVDGLSTSGTENDQILKLNNLQNIINNLLFNSSIAT